MIRKLVLGLAAAAMVAGASLAATPASAGGFHHHHHRHHRHIYFAPAPVFVAPVIAPSCLQKRLVQTFKGLRWRTVNVCAF